MVTVVRLHPQSSAAALGPVAEGLSGPERELIGRALDFAEPLYAGQTLSTGEPTWAHALGLAGNLAAIGVDATARAAGILFAAPKYLSGDLSLGQVTQLARGLCVAPDRHDARARSPTQQLGHDVEHLSRKLPRRASNRSRSFAVVTI